LDLVDVERSLTDVVVVQLLNQLMLDDTGIYTRAGLPASTWSKPGVRPQLSIAAAAGASSAEQTHAALIDDLVELIGGTTATHPRAQAALVQQAVQSARATPPHTAPRVPPTPATRAPAAQHTQQPLLQPGRAPVLPDAATAAQRWIAVRTRANHVCVRCDCPL
jgi:hypothetical protein